LDDYLSEEILKAKVKKIKILKMLKKLNQSLISTTSGLLWLQEDSILLLQSFLQMSMVQLHFLLQLRIKGTAFQISKTQTKF